MAVVIATGDITITDYNDAVNLFSYIGTNMSDRTQQFDPAGTGDSAYNPNWATVNNVLTPYVYIAGAGATDSTNYATTTRVSNIKWYQVVSGVETEIISGTNGYTILTTGAKTLTIATNDLVNLPGKTYIFRCNYTDPNSNLVVPVVADITFSKVVNGSAFVRAALTYPEGLVFKNSSVTYIPLHIELWRGSVKDTSNVTYEWYQMDSTILTDVGGGIGWRKLSNVAGTTEITNNDLKVYSKQVINFGVFKGLCIDGDSSSPTYNTKFADVATIVDNTDPIVVEVTSSAGKVFKTGGAASTTLTAVLKQSGVVTDSAGTAYTYTWTKWNNSGTKVNFFDNSPSKTGKTITVTPDDVDITNQFIVEISR